MARLRLLLRSARLLGLVALGLGLAAWVSLRERLPGADVTPPDMSAACEVEVGIGALSIDDVVAVGVPAARSSPAVTRAVEALRQMTATSECA